jgi:hypothetical protein
VKVKPTTQLGPCEVLGTTGHKSTRTATAENVRKKRKVLSLNDGVRRPSGTVPSWYAGRRLTRTRKVQGVAKGSETKVTSQLSGSIFGSK